MSDMRQERISVRLPAQLRRRLKAAARRTGVSESDLVRASVENQLSETAYTLAKKAGIIGAVEGLSRDLSTNRKHFAGFGS